MLIKVWRPKLNTGSTIPWAIVLLWIKMSQSELNTSIQYSLFWLLLGAWVQCNKLTPALDSTPSLQGGSISPAHLPCREELYLLHTCPAERNYISCTPALQGGTILPESVSQNQPLVWICILQYCATETWRVKLIQVTCLKVTLYIY